MSLRVATTLACALLLSGCLACEDGSRFRFGDAGAPEDAAPRDAGPDAGPGDDAGPFDAGPREPEPCNGEDDDSDGLVDESCALTQMSLAGSLACARTVGGEVVCAGDGQLGQLGDGLRGVRGSLSRVPNLAGITEVAVGNAHACALHADGRVSCWGFGGNGRLGLAAFEAQLTPVRVMDLSDAEELAVGRAFSCARGGGQVFCWGANGSGQTGDGQLADHPAAAAIVGVTDAVAIAAGDAHACVVHSGGAVSCFGDNTSAQINGASGPNAATPQRLPALVGVEALALGTRHSCALGVGGDVNCWGSNARGQLGRADLSSTAVQPVTGLDSALAIAAGDEHSCALTQTDSGATEVHCWGSNRASQVGGTDLTRTSPRLVSFASGAAPRAIWAGGQTTCAQLDDLRTYCWGSDTHGQLGIGAQLVYTAPQRVLEGMDVDEVSLGFDFTCARIGPVIRCVGSNAHGQLGRDAPDLVATGTWGMAGMGLGLSFTTVAAGEQHACAISASQHGFCWGRGGASRLGGTDVEDAFAMRSLERSPDTALGLMRAPMRLGGLHACIAVAGTGGGFAMCWGANDQGQLGRGNAAYIPRPDPVRFPTGPTHPASLMAAGDRHSCALLDGTQGADGVYCWGADDRGQIRGAVGGSPAVEPALLDLGGLEPDALAAGGTHTCARGRAGSVRCWGDNERGQLGVPVSAPHAPSAAVSLTEIEGVFALGANHTCGTNSAGAVQCWGDGALGQTGRPDLATTHEGALVAVSGGGVTALAASATRTCALSGQSLYCWGADLAGSLGVGRVLFFPTPQLVPSIGEAP